MDFARIMTLLPFLVFAACAAGVFFSTRNSCDKSIGKLPGVGKVCKTKFVTWAVLALALLCGCSGLTVTRTVLG